MSLLARLSHHLATTEDDGSQTPAGTPGLSPHEHVVLAAHSVYKSSHMGMDRRKMVHQNDSHHVPKGTWDGAKTSLQAKGHLNKAGAITPQGKAHLKALHPHGITSVSGIVAQHKLPTIDPANHKYEAEATVSLKDRIGAKTLTEAAGSAKARPLWEDLVAKPMRFWNARDIQYAIEDLATAAERYEDGEGRFGYARKSGRRGDSCEGEKKAKEMLKGALATLRDSASSFKKFADHCDADY